MMPNEDSDGKPAADEKMVFYAKNPVLTKNEKKERKWYLIQSARYISSSIYLYPIVTDKSFKGSHKYNIHAELDYHADTSVVGFNVLVVHNHEHFVDVYGYDSKSRHDNITNVDAVVTYDDP